MAGHGTYGRRTPPGTRVRRWYCRNCQQTFSALPDCLAARMPGSLRDVEDRVAHAEAEGVWSAVRRFEPEAIDLSSAWRAISRRLLLVHAFLRTALGLLPDLPAGAEPTVRSMRRALGTPDALMAMRGLCAGHLRHMPPPVGFRPPESARALKTGPPTANSRRQGPAVRREPPPTAGERPNREVRQ